MEKEVSYAIELGVTLAIISALLAVVFFTVQLGHGVKADAFEESTRIVADLAEGNMYDLVGKENKMSSAAAYSLLRTHGSVIPELVCYDSSHGGGSTKFVTDLTTDTPCIFKHLRGRVNLEVELMHDSWYRVTIHDEDCTWYYGTCTD